MNNTEIQKENDVKIKIKIRKLVPLVRFSIDVLFWFCFIFIYFFEQ